MNDHRASGSSAKNPAIAAVHRHSVHTASIAPCASPTGGSIAMRYLNDPKVPVQPSRKVSSDGTTLPTVVVLRHTTGPTTHCATTRKTNCHHRRRAGKTPAKAIAAPAAAAGTAAAAHSANDP